MHFTPIKLVRTIRFELDANCGGYVVLKEFSCCKHSKIVNYVARELKNLIYYITYDDRVLKYWPQV